MTELEIAELKIKELEDRVVKLMDQVAETVANCADLEDKVSILANDKLILQDKLDMSNSCCKAKSEEIENFKHTVSRLEAELEHSRKMSEDYKKSFDTLYAGSNAMSQQLNDEKQKNEELTNIITDLTKAVLNLSDIIE